MRKILTLMCIMCASVYAFAQQKISGTVTSEESGEALAGVSVFEKGTNNGTLTDQNGSFEMKTIGDEATIVFRYIGMGTIELPAGPSMEVSLKSDDLLVDEVVVTALGIATEKKALGYSVQSVGGDDVVRSGEANAIQGLAGKVAGVQVISSAGVPGGSSFIRIRGSSSLTGNNQPLIIVDGVPIDNSQNLSGNPDDGNNNLLGAVANSNRGIDINPEDIENVSVLKGPNAAALYGIQAANGAIVITTKKGRANSGKAINVSYNGSVAFDKVNKLPGLQNMYVQGTGWFDPDPTWYGPDQGWPTSWGPLADTMYWDGSQYDYDNNGMLVGQSSPNAGQKFVPYNNADNFFKTGTTFNNNIALSGGNASTTYRLSVGALDQNGIVPNSEFSRTTVKFAGESQLTSRIKSAASVAYTNSGGQRVQQGSNTSGLMLGLLRTPISFDNSNGLEDPVNDEGSYILPDGRQRNYRGGGGYDNPYWTINKNPHTDDVNRVFGFTSVSIDATKWLNVFYRVGTDFYSDRRKQVFGIGSRTIQGGVGQIYEEQIAYRNLNSDLWLTANHDFTEDLSGSLMVGNNLYDQKTQRLFTQGTGFNIADFAHISNAQEILSREESTWRRTAAVFVDAKLSYKDYLYLNLTGRNEWASTLPADKRSFFYPSASVGFVFTEPFGLSDNKVLPYGKIRLSYAQVGNIPGVYETSTFYEPTVVGDGWTSGTPFPFQGTTGFSLSGTQGNPNLRPEKTNSLEAGLDLRFLNNRLGLDATIYKSNSVDQIFAVQVATSSGYRSVIKNAGEVENKGIELVLNATPVKTKSFRWDLQLNWTLNRNTVISLDDDVENLFLGGFEGSSIRNVAGQPFGQIYGGTWLRDDNGNIVIENDTNSAYFGYPIASGTEAVIGNPNPDWLAGLRNTLSWKGLSLSFLIDIRKGGDIWNGTRGALTYFGMSELTENRGDMVVFEGVAGTVDADGNIVSNGETNSASVALNEDWYTDNGGGFGIVSEHFVEDGSSIRLRELNIGYEFKPSFLEKTPFRTLNVGFTGRNLWLSTKYTGVDPDTNLMGANNAQGLDYFQMPNTKSFMFNLGVGL